MKLSELGPLEAACLDTGLGKKKKEFCSSKTSPVSDLYPGRYPMEKERHLQTQAWSWFLIPLSFAKKALNLKSPMPTHLFSIDAKESYFLDRNDESRAPLLVNPLLKELPGNRTKNSGAEVLGRGQVVARVMSFKVSLHRGPRGLGR